MVTLAVASIHGLCADVALKVSGGSGTESDPYLIATKADLLELAAACNTPEGTATNGTTASHYQGTYFRQTADIDLAGDESFTGIAVAPQKFSPGTTWKFQGTYDGGGHTVKGMKINGIVLDADGKAMTSGADRSRSYVGFFGYLDGATVKNLNFAADCHVDGYQYVGTLAGYVDKGTVIENCTSRASVDAYDSYAGGILGRGNATKALPASVSDCFFSGSVRVCNSNGGGIAGGVSSQYFTIARCVNAGDVSGVSFNPIKADGLQTVVGGIAGTMSGQIEDCFNAGRVSASKEKAGGIAGTFSGTTSYMRRSVNIGSVECPSVVTSGMIAGTSSGKLENCFYDASMWGNRAAANAPLAGVTGLTTQQFTSGNLPEGLTPSLWTCAKGFYPVPAAWATNDVIHRTAAAYLLFPEGQSARDLRTSATLSSAMDGMTMSLPQGETGFTVSGNTVALADNTEHIVESVLTIVNGPVSVSVPLVGVPVFFTGTGTADDPFIIDSPKALGGLAELCNGPQEQHFSGMHFRQSADIDMTGTDFRGVAVTTAYSTAANLTKYFCGHYDGGGFRISGVKVDGVGRKEDNSLNSMTSYASVGLFGAVRDGALIENVNIDKSCEFTGYNNVGALVGELGENVVIRNCVSAAKVIALGRKAGGIVGNNTVGSKNYELNNVSISACVFTGSVTTNDSYAGGIIGSNDAIVTGCVNSGAVSVSVVDENIKPGSSAYVGGIAGYNGGDLRECLNTGSVTAENPYTGGIVGQNVATHKRGALTACVSAGQVLSSGAVNVGAIVGSEVVSSSNNPVVTGNFYDMQYCSYGVSGSSTVKVEGTALETAALTSGTLPEGLSGFSAGPGRYPLPAGVTENASAIAAASTFMTMADGETLGNFTEGTLATAIALAATVENDNTVFYVADGKVMSHSVSEPAEGYVVISSDLSARRLQLKKVPGILPGNGTEAEPFIVASADDMIKLAQSVETMRYDYSGRWFRLDSDIDFTDKVLTPIGSETCMFNGIFDGAGHTVSNVTNPAPQDMLQRDRALFGIIGPKGVVRNLNLATSDIRGNQSTGGISAGLHGRIENCSVGEGCIIFSTPAVNEESIHKEYVGDFAGGIAARMQPGAVITGCRNAAKVVAEHDAGGILGASLAPGALIENCVNDGEIGAVAYPIELFSGNGRAGGIAGRFSGTIRNCVNNGHIAVTSINCGGGIVGWARPMTDISGCVNNGLVEINWLDGGGIIGVTEAEATSETPVIVTDCLNHGEVSTTSGSGGIIGLANGNVSVTDCSNTAFVHARDGASAAGIIAQTERNVSVTGCYNLGATSANRGAAGIVGEAFSSGLVIKECFNAGDVTVTTESSGVIPQSAGGITNSYYEAGFTVESCYNLGKVSGQRNIGGIAGHAFNATVKNCYNMGEVDAIATAGNIVGDASSTDVTGCVIADTMAALPADGEIERLDEIALMTAPLGDGFVYQTACLPRVNGLELVPVAVINAARYLLSGDDNPDNVTGEITLASVEGLQWSVEGPASITDDTAVPSDKGEIVLTATIDNLTRSYTLVSNYEKPKDGIDNISGDSEVKVLRRFNLQGVGIDNPADGSVYIEVLENGTVRKRVH